MALTGRDYVISAGEHQATIVEIGAGLRSYTHAGRDVVATYSGDVLPPKCAGGVLVPWPNRLRDGRYTFDGVDYQLPLTEPKTRNAIHGLGRWERWRALEHQPDQVLLRLDISPQTGWPFEVRVEVRYAIDAEQGLAVTTTATNLGTRRAPFGAGFHPYLSAAGAALADVSVTLPARQRLVLDEVQVPVGVQAVSKTPYDFQSGKKLKTVRMDDGFTDLITEDGRGVAAVRGKTGGAQLWFDETFRYLQAFTAEVFADGVPAVAIEPMTCAPDAFNSGDGLMILEPGGSWSGTWGIQPLI
jgi:aldose 1-epimerase